MLNIYFGRWNIDDENYIWNMNSYFDNNFEDEWITDPISKKIIEDIDGSKVISGKVIDSPILGVISPFYLAGGVKLLITMNIEGDKNIYNGTKCGPNCSDWILRIANEKEIIICREYPIKFSENEFKIKILNDNSFVYNNKELTDKYLEFRYSERIGV